MGYPLGATNLPNLWASIKSLLRITGSTTGAGMIPVIIRIPATLLTGDIDVIIDNKIRVVDVWAVGTGTGAAADTLVVKNLTNAISSVLDMNIADTTIARTTTLDDAYTDIEAGGTLRVTGASAVNGVVYVSAILIP